LKATVYPTYRIVTEKSSSIQKCWGYRDLSPGS